MLEELKKTAEKTKPSLVDILGCLYEQHMHVMQQSHLGDFIIYFSGTCEKNYFLI